MDMRKMVKIGYSVLLIVALLAGMVAVSPPQPTAAAAAPPVDGAPLSVPINNDSDPAVEADSAESGYHVSQQTGETWVEICQHQFPVQYSTEAFTADVMDGKVVLRIVQSGKPFADIDQISLKAGNEEFNPGAEAGREDHFAKFPYSQ